MALKRTTRFLAILLLFLLVANLSVCYKYRKYVADKKLFDNLLIDTNDEARENSWIIGIDFKNKLVQVQTVVGKTDIVFRAEDEFLDFLWLPGSDRGKLSWILPVTFYCNGKPDKNCDLEKPYTLRVGRYKVEPIEIVKRPP